MSVVGGVDRSLSGHRLAASQPDIGSDPTHILPFHSLKAKEACTEGTAVVTQPSWTISSTGVSPPDRCVPHQPHHPSQPDMGGSDGATIAEEPVRALRGTQAAAAARLSVARIALSARVRQPVETVTS